MTWQPHPFAFALFGTAAIAAAVGVAVWRRPAPGARTCALLMAALAWWSAAYAAELLSVSRAVQLAWIKVEYVGILAAPLAWLLFTLRFTGRDAWLSPAVHAVLCAVPAALYALVLTDGRLHQLFYAHAETVQVGGWAVLHIVYGPAGWANVVYAYLCLAGGVLVILHAFANSPRIYRRQVLALLAAAAAPWAANLAYMFGADVGVDLTPLAFTVTGLAAAWALRNAQLLDLAPVAREHVVESLPDGIAVLDNQDRIVDANAAFLRLVDRSAAALVGQTASTALAHRPALLAALATPDGARLSVGDADPPHLYHGVAGPLRDRRGRSVGRLLTLRDITERERVIAELARARDAAEALVRAKADFLATVSHEIRTPMNGVVGMTGLLLGTPLSGEQREYVEVIRGSADQLLAIINDILDFSKIESGRMQVESLPFAPRQVIAGAIDLLRPQAEARGLRLSLVATPAVPGRCLGDPTRVRQIALNLIGNAIKFTPAGEVTVTLDAGEPVDGAQRLSLSVRDTGIGIPPERLDRLFQPFSQVDASTARRYGGSGLGLAISRRLAELMGGTVRGESAPGAGSTFRAEWQVREAPAEAALPAPPPASADPRAAPLRILVAEDNPVNQKVVLRMLERVGYHADLAADGARAVDAVAEGDYDVVLMDVQMPDMDGFEATRRIRGRASARQPRIIAMTANAMAGDRERCLAAGMDDYVSKPLRLDDLRAVLARAA